MPVRLVTSVENYLTTPPWTLPSSWRGNKTSPQNHNFLHPTVNLFYSTYMFIQVATMSSLRGPHLAFTIHSCPFSLIWILVHPKTVQSLPKEPKEKLEMLSKPLSFERCLSVSSPFNYSFQREEKIIKKSFQERSRK